MLTFLSNLIKKKKLLPLLIPYSDQALNRFFMNESEFFRKIEHLSTIASAQVCKTSRFKSSGSFSNDDSCDEKKNSTFHSVGE